MAKALKHLLISWHVPGVRSVGGGALFPGGRQGPAASRLPENHRLWPGAAGIKPEDFIRHFDTMLQSQKLPPEAAGLFQGIRGIMEGAAKGQDAQTLREKSGGLLQGMRPLMEKPACRRKRPPCLNLLRT